MDLKNLSEEEIVELVKEKKVTGADLTDNGICPTCFNTKHNGVLFGDDSPRMIYEDEDFRCFLVGNPRCIGHTVIITKEHYKDMMEIDDELCSNAESVYLCTMCDGPMNHFHVQLIPRYDYEKRGSKNFVKERSDYVEDKEKLNNLYIKK